MEDRRLTKVDREAGIHYRCPECHRLNGDHLDDCTGAMMAAGSRDPIAAEKAMRRQVLDGLGED